MKEEKIIKHKKRAKAYIIKLVREIEK